MYIIGRVQGIGDAHLHNEEFQVLLDMTLGRESLAFLVGKGGGVGIHASGQAGTGQRVGVGVAQQSYSLLLR